MPAHAQGQSGFSQALIEKIRTLSPESIAEIEGFVDFLRARDSDRALTRAALASSETAFAKVWSNPEDDAYDAL
ncbi:MAG: hypothetical protein ACOYKM_14795 [Caulobacterales bacterium]